MNDRLKRLRRMFYPESVAVIGASASPEKWGFGILHNLIQGKFPGKIYPINPIREQILGVPCHKKLSDVPGPVELVVLVVPPEQLFQAVDDTIAKKPAGVVIITAGLGEVDEEGKRKEQEIGRKLKAAEIEGLGPNCQGMVCTQANLFPQYVWVFPKPGKISILSQSGNVGTTIASRGAWSGIGFSKFISYGNEGVTPLDVLLEYLGEDPDTGVICSYIEGVKDGRALVEALSRITPKKPVVILKGGATEAGSRAASSHSGALAGKKEVFLSACRQAGAVIVNDLDSLFYATVTLAHQPLPKSNQIGVVTWGGGWGVLAADECAKQGLELPRLPDELIQGLNGILAYRWSHNNPVDLATSGGNRALMKVLEMVARSPAFDGIVHIGIGISHAARKMTAESFYLSAPEQAGLKDMFIKHSSRSDELLAQKIIDLSGELNKPILVSSDMASIPGPENVAWSVLKEQGRLIYPTPNDAARAMSYLVQYRSFLARKRSM